MSRSLMVVLAVAAFFCGLPVQAQYLPLHLDQTIPLPAANGLWDVMPNPDGYYLWVQAVQPFTEHTRIYWGRTDLGNRDSIELSVGSPQSITCFWRESHTPYVVLGSRYAFPGPNGYTFDSTYFRIYRLQDGLADTSYWLWQAYHSVPGPGLNSNEYQWDFKAMTVALYPSPQASTQVLVPISHSDRIQSTHIGDTYWGTWTLLDIISMLRDTSNRSMILPHDGMFASWCDVADALAIVYFGEHNTSGSSMGHSWEQSSSTIHAIFSTSDSFTVAAPLWSCAAGTYGACLSSPVAATYDSQMQRVLCFSRLNNTYGMRSSPPGATYWSVPGPYNHWLAAECISGNSTEEFLAYASKRRFFDVFNATNGHYYGRTDTITCAASEIKTIGRYDSTSRRLATRSTNQLKLYTFGQYLVADDPNVILHPSSFILSAFPNPFNPGCTISFSLPSISKVKLTVFDITGRKVQSLSEGMLSAGEHKVQFDGSALPSGIYFARLESASAIKTQKLLLLK